MTRNTGKNAKLNSSKYSALVAPLAGFATLLIFTLISISPVVAQTNTSAKTIERSLSAPPQRITRPEDRVGRKTFKRSYKLRKLAPSVNIRSINFAFGSAQIAPSQYNKVDMIGIAMRRILRRRPGEVFLIEGHTDAVGSRANNQRLSQRRARSLARYLHLEFNIPFRSLETAGYGEDLLLVQTSRANLRNRRVTLRRITDFITR